MSKFKKYKSILNIFTKDRETHKLIPGQYSSPEVEYLKYCNWDFTEKIDGKNVRCIISKDGLQVRGRKDSTELPPELMDNIHALLEPRIPYFMKVFDLPICLRGEGYGSGIQKGGGLYRDDKSIIFFDLEYKEGHYMNRSFLYQFLSQTLQLPIVPVIAHGPLAVGVKIVTDGLLSIVADRHRFAEGLVARPSLMVLDHHANRIAVKIKHRDFYKYQEVCHE